MSELVTRAAQEAIRQVSQEEIDWAKSKIADLNKTVRRVLKEAMDLGEWFNDVQHRLGFDVRGGRNNGWKRWVQGKFPHVEYRTLANYQQLAHNREYVETKLQLNSAPMQSLNSRPPTINQAIRLIRQRNADRERTRIINLEDGPLLLEGAPDPIRKALLELREQLKSYIYQFYQLDHLAALIESNMKVAGLNKRQRREALEWAAKEHPDMRQPLLDAFLVLGRSRPTKN